MKPKAVIIWSDIGHYHDARLRFAAAASRFEIIAVEIFNQAMFPEFRVEAHDAYGYRRYGLGLKPPASRSAIQEPLFRLLASIEPAVVFVPGWSGAAALLALNWGLSHGVPCVLMSDSTAADFARNPLKEAVKKQIVKLAASAFVAGKPQAEYLLGLGMTPERMFFGYDVVENKHFFNGAQQVRQNQSVMREALRLPPKYFLCCARLAPEKNPLTLIEAYLLYCKRQTGDPWSLIFVGTGPLRQQLEEKIEEYGLEGKAVLAGTKKYDELPAYYGLAEALILASVSEPWGLVINEAMSAGLPILASTRCGSGPDLVENGKNGFTFDPYNTEEIASVLEAISSPDCDREAMGRRSREIIAGWDLDRFVKGMDAAGTSALAHATSRHSIVGRTTLKLLSVR